MHPDAVGLHHRQLAVEVDDQAGQKVAFAVHQTIHVVVAPHHTDGFPHAPGRTEALFPEAGVDGLAAEGQHAQGDAAHLPVSLGHIAAVGGVDGDDIALFGLALHALHGAGEHPGMEASEAFLLTPLQI